jgi:glycosyltransferase involved in cell wall biosynthesis
MNIFVYNGQTHVGGGQTYIQNIVIELQKLHHHVYLDQDALSRQTLQKLFRRSFDVVVLNVYFPRDLLLSLCLLLLRIPVINVVHGIWFLERRSMNVKQSFVTTFKYWITQYMMCLAAHKVVVVCEYERILLEKYFPGIRNKTVIIPGASDKKLFYPCRWAEIPSVRKQLHLPQANILLMVTRLERRKGIELAIQAVRKLIQKKPNTLLLIIFPSGIFYPVGYFLELLQLVDSLSIGPHVHFITGISGTALTAYYQSADMFIMSSKELENFSLSCMESLSCGCPVITFSTGGTPELIRQIDAHLVTKTVAAQSLSRGILWYLSLSKRRKIYIRKRVLRISALYSWRKSAAKFFSIMADACP